jgi:hypothetical protein
METSESQERMPHVENVRLVKEAKSSDAGATGFDGRSALLPFGLSVLAVLAGIAAYDSFRHVSFDNGIIGSPSHLSSVMTRAQYLRPLSANRPAALQAL